MTDEYEQAINRVADELARRGFTETFQTARAILELTYPSGQRVLAVLAKDQTLPQYNPVDAANSEFTYPDAYMHAQSDMFRAGFRRVVYPALKQEAK